MAYNVASCRESFLHVNISLLNKQKNVIQLKPGLFQFVNKRSFTYYDTAAMYAC